MIKAYGDTLNDGVMQLSFTLPAEGPAAALAAKALCQKMGLEEPKVVHQAAMGGGYTFFVIYAQCPMGVELPEVEPEPALPSFEELNLEIRRRLGRRVVVVGACTGSDAHTVGLDAILNNKGYRGDYGLERYPELVVHNLGAQVSNEALVGKIRELGAEVVLVSQVVTQKEVHLRNLTALVDLLEAEGLRERLLLICGGPRLSHELALELGFDAGFGPGTLPRQVVHFLVGALAQR